MPTTLSGSFRTRDPLGGAPLPPPGAQACPACRRLDGRPGWARPHTTLVQVASIDANGEVETRYHCWECGARWQRLLGAVPATGRWALLR